MSISATRTILGLAVITVAASPIAARGVAAQSALPNTCGLLTNDEVHALAPKEQVSTGVSRSLQAVDASSCQYSWGSGVNRFTLAVSVDSASRAFATMNTDAIKQQFAGAVKPESMDAAVPDVGDAAMFTAASPAYATASALVKNRILRISLEGIDAPLHKGELISLLKSAAGKL